MSGKLKKNLILAVVIGSLIIAGVIIYKTIYKNSGFLPPHQAAEKTINFINQNLLPKGTTASLLNVIEENGLYKIHFKIGEREIDSYVTKNGKLLFVEGIDLDAKPETSREPATEKTFTIGNFEVGKDEICKEDEKPIVYFFGSKSCPHCLWEHPILEKAARNFEGLISFHNNMDSQADMDIFGKYSNGSIPTLVLGCKYSRVGSGESLGEEEESNALTALMCKLTENKPTETCNKVQNLIDQIKQ